MKYYFILFLLLFSLLHGQTITPIASVVESFPGNTGQSFTIQGVVTIGTEDHHVGRLRAFVQDSSGKGIALDNPSITQTHLQNIRQGYFIRVTGVVSEYGQAPQLASLSNIQALEYEVVPIKELSIQEAINYQPHFGLYVQVSGNIHRIDPPSTSAGRNVTLRDNSNRELTIRFWNTFGIDISMLRVGTPVDIIGGLSAFNGTAQLIPGYQRDIIINLTDPVISSITINPETPYIDQQVHISASIVDYNGRIETAVLFYKTESRDFTPINMTSSSGDTYFAILPAYNTLESGEGNYIYHIIATDNDGDSTNSGDRRLFSSYRRPIISNINIVNRPEADESIILHAVIRDSNEHGAIIQAKVLYTINFSSNELEVEMENISGILYEAVVPGYSAGTTVNMSIFAENDSNYTQLVDKFSEDETPIRYVFPVRENNVMLRIQPKAYNIFEGDEVEIGYFVKSGDIVVIRIYNSEGKLVSTPVNRITSAIDGINFYNWNGRDNEFRLVQPGLYVCHLEVRDRESGAIKNDKAPIVIGTRLK